MFSLGIRAVTVAARSLSTSTRASSKVAVLGGAGGIGQPLSLLMKQNPLVTRLAVYDIAHSKGVASDLSHINTGAQVEGFVGDELDDALKGSDVVVIPAGVPRKPGMTRDDLFNTNASIVQNLIGRIAAVCPQAKICIITNPVNSTIAIAGEVLRKAGVQGYEKRLFGVTTLDVTRARTFVAERKGLDVSGVDVPVIGGHAGVTILPLLSRTGTTFTDEERDQLTVRIQNGGTEVVEAKAGAGSATLSMAYAGAEFVDNLLRAAKGEKVVACTMVQSDVVKGCKYFANPVELNADGVAQNLGLGDLSDYEAQKLQDEVVPELSGSIAKGEAFNN